MIRIAMIRIAALAVALMVFATHVRGDVLVTRDNRRIEGKLVSKDDKTVVFDVYRFGIYTRSNFHADEVFQVIEGALPQPSTKPAENPAAGDKDPAAPPVIRYAVPTYYLIPLRGVVRRRFIHRRDLAPMRGTPPSRPDSSPRSFGDRVGDCF